MNGIIVRRSQVANFVMRQEQIDQSLIFITEIVGNRLKSYDNGKAQTCT